MQEIKNINQFDYFSKTNQLNSLCKLPAIRIASPFELQPSLWLHDLGYPLFNIKYYPPQKVLQSNCTMSNNFTTRREHYSFLDPSIMTIYFQTVVTVN